MKNNAISSPTTLMLKITSGKAGPQYKFPEKPVRFKVNVESSPVCVVPDEDMKSNEGDIRYHKLQFYARVMGGRYKGLLVIITRVFDPPEKDILDGVELEYGMVVEVVGNLDFYIWKGQAPIPARFDITATSMGKPYREDNEIWDKPSKFVLQLRSWLETDVDESGRHPMPQLMED
ncbi:hypothetical protein BGX30_005838, partial [Mortierella sp. GBA39]